MTYKLFLDDERDPVGDDWVVARSYHAAKWIVERYGSPVHVQFDHDLGNDFTGAMFASWLVERAIDGNGFPDSYDVHSQNPVGAKNIRGIMDHYIKYFR